MRFVRKEGIEIWMFQQEDINVKTFIKSKKIIILSYYKKKLENQFKEI